MDENKPLSKYNNIPFGHSRANHGAMCITLKSTSKLRSFLHFRYSIVTHARFIPHANKAQL